MPDLAQRPMSLVEIITEALQETAKQASGQNVGLAWTVDPALPPYISAKRVDLQSIVMVLIHRALSVMQASPLHLTIAGNGPDRARRDAIIRPSPFRKMYLDIPIPGDRPLQRMPG